MSKISRFIKNRACFALVWVPLLALGFCIEEGAVELPEVLAPIWLLLWMILLLTRLYLIGFKVVGLVFWF